MIDKLTEGQAGRKTTIQTVMLKSVQTFNVQTLHTLIFNGRITLGPRSMVGSMIYALMQPDLPADL